MSSDRIIELFKRSVLEFLDELIIQFPDISGDFVIARLLVKDQLDIREVINRINEKLLKNNSIRKMITDKNDQFFLADQSIFLDVNPERVCRFRDIWRVRLDTQDKETVWKWMSVFVMLIDRYVKSLTP
jgi:hypothetical protein